MKLVTWNVNSLTVRLPRLLGWLAVNRPDVVCLQETKVEDAKFPHLDIEAALVTTRRRIEAFRATVRRTHGAVAEVCIREPDDEAFTRQVGVILDRADRPTAAIGSNSALTLALLKALRERGVVIPRDLSVIAFDAPGWSQLLTPPLAVVRPPTRDIARMAWNLLLRRMREPGMVAERIELSAAIELTGSVAAVPAPNSVQR